MSETKDILHRLALVSKSYGTTGEIIINLSPDVPQDMDLSEPVFIFFDKLPVPFFIESLSRRGKNKALIKIDGIDTLDEAEELCGMSIYFHSQDEDPREQEDLIGYSLLDQRDNLTGKIIGISDFSGNICLMVRHLKEDIYVPLHEDLIIAIDNKKRTITLEIAEGLI